MSTLDVWIVVVVKCVGALTLSLSLLWLCLYLIDWGMEGVIRTVGISESVIRFCREHRGSKSDHWWFRRMEDWWRGLFNKSEDDEP